MTSLNHNQPTDTSNSYFNIPEPDKAKNNPNASSCMDVFGEILQTLIVAIILYMLIDTMVARVRVENVSMQPTLHEGQFVFVNKLAYRLGSFRRGDIIIFHHDATEDYVKRVIGLPGDMVAVIGGQVYVNWVILIEPYIAAPPQYSGTWKVPEGQLFVLGDNRNQSSDSHQWGYIPETSVVGKALMIYWPLGQIKILNEVPIEVLVFN